MKPDRLLAIVAIVIVLIVAVLYLASGDETFLEPDNTGPPEISQSPGAGNDPSPSKVAADPEVS